MEENTKDAVLKRFLRDTEKHEMTIEQNTGVFRSVLFKRPGSSNCYFRINTWPRHLCMSGDMGCYVFSRLDDMFEFFRGDDLTINIGYWTEKLQSISCFGSNEGAVSQFDAQDTAECVKSALNDDEGSLEKYAEQLKELADSSDAHEAMRIMQEIDCLRDTWEYLCKKPTFHIQWCLYAIRWAIQKYDSTS